MRVRGSAARKIRLGDGDDAGSPRLHLPNESMEELQTRSGGRREGRQQLLRARGVTPPEESLGPPVKPRYRCSGAVCVVLERGVWLMLECRRLRD